MIMTKSEKLLDKIADQVIDLGEERADLKARLRRVESAADRVVLRAKLVALNAEIGTATEKFSAVRAGKPKLGRPPKKLESEARIPDAVADLDPPGMRDDEELEKQSPATTLETGEGE
jgi:hypothetical protein